MPAVQSGLILVTGASGFVGTHTVARLLDAGYRVRAVVRSAEKGDHIRALYPGQEDKIEYAIVEDMSVDGAYDEAVKGVNGILHIASPVDLTNVGHPDTIIQPALKGVTGILNATAKNGDKVQRIVQVSSIASVYTPGAGPKKHFDEKDWNDESIAIAKAQGEATPAAVKYLASKTIAERAFWEWLEEHKPAFDGVSLLPAMIFGPPTAYTASANDINGSLSLGLPYLKPGADLKAELFNLVDVRDVAAALVSALQAPEAAGERIILSGHTLYGNDIAVAAERAFPDAGLGANTDPEFSKAIRENGYVIDGSKATKVLGLKYTAKDKTLDDTVREVYPKLRAQAVAA